MKVDWSEIERRFIEEIGEAMNFKFSRGVKVGIAFIKKQRWGNRDFLNFLIIFKSMMFQVQFKWYNIYCQVPVTSTTSENEIFNASWEVLHRRTFLVLYYEGECKSIIEGFEKGNWLWLRSLSLSLSLSIYLSKTYQSSKKVKESIRCTEQQSKA